MEETKIPVVVTHYQVLNLTPALLDSHHNPSTLIKRAYHRALLQNHPDKAAQSPASSFYSVDQITNAYTVLCSPKERAAYDTSIRLAQQGSQDSTSVQFRTGVENVDLDDLPYDEDKDLWYRSCRCGNDRGYVFSENDLEEVGDEGELMVGCLDCSLWLNVHFAQVDNDDTNETYGPRPLQLRERASIITGNLPSLAYFASKARSVNGFLLCELKRPECHQAHFQPKPIRKIVCKIKRRPAPCSYTHALSDT